MVHPRNIPQCPESWDPQVLLATQSTQDGKVRKKIYIYIYGKLQIHVSSSGQGQTHKHRDLNSKGDEVSPPQQAPLAVRAAQLKSGFTGIVSQTSNKPWEVGVVLVLISQISKSRLREVR